MRNQNGHLDIELNNLFVEQEISKQAYGQHSQDLIMLNFVIFIQFIIHI